MSTNGNKSSSIHPNYLTLYRILAVPGVVILMLFENRFSAFMAAILFSAAAITDYMDGYLARTRGLVTNLGKMMDPLADKLLISSSFIMLAANDWVPAWMVCIIISREFVVTGLRSAADHTKEDLSSSWLGKYKTGFQIAAIIPLMIHYPYFGIKLEVIGEFFLWGALIFTIWSGIDYYNKYRKFIPM
ncbi:MAG: CDP-diacylglycerol--glycerol-3-phosphate 3-phosphatidyltransferase [Desulfobacterales bacterium]